MDLEKMLMGSRTFAIEGTSLPSLLSSRYVYSCDGCL